MKIGDIRYHPPTVELEGVSPKEGKEKLKKACRDFESIFIYQLLKAMRTTIPTGGLFKSSRGNTHETLMDLMLAEEMVKKGEGLGLDKILYNQLSKNTGPDVDKGTEIKTGGEKNLSFPLISR